MGVRAAGSCCLLQSSFRKTRHTGPAKSPSPSYGKGLRAPAQERPQPDCPNTGGAPAAAWALQRGFQHSPGSPCTPRVSRGASYAFRVASQRLIGKNTGRDPSAAAAAARPCAAPPRCGASSRGVQELTIAASSLPEAGARTPRAGISRLRWQTASSPTSLPAEPPAGTHAASTPSLW